jgi:hypothetical protein
MKFELMHILYVIIFLNLPLDTSIYRQKEINILYALLCVLWTENSGE